MTKPLLICTTLVLASPLVACTTDAADDASPAFSVTSKSVTIQPGEEVTYCYYFHTPNAAPLAISKWSSDLQPGSHHLILFYGAASQPPDGTLSTGDCGSPTGSNLPFIPVWVYGAQTPHNELPMPADDGTGKPIAMVVPAGQPAYLQLHYVNASDAPITAAATVNAYAYAAGTAYTETAAYIAYNSKIEIPPHAVGHVERQSCATPAGSQFWWVSTHAHKQAVQTKLEDGPAMAFSSTDWEHPGTKQWASAPYYTFVSSRMTYECTYDNLGDNADKTLVAGPSAQTDEMCMGVGYYFPATGSKFCLDDQGPF